MDPRGLTVTGGLPYFGGPGSAYVAHSIATMVELCRADPGSIGAAVGVGGLVSRFAVGAISTDPGDRPFQFDPCTDVEERLATEGVEVELSAEGVAVIEAMTVLHDREAGPVAVPVFARFGDGRRTGARLLHPELASELSNESLIGKEVRIVVEDDGPRYDLR
jgi:acetyl-CoA C-acetyltransferase